MKKSTLAPCTVLSQESGTVGTGKAAMKVKNRSCVLPLPFMPVFLNYYDVIKLLVYHTVLVPGAGRYSFLLSYGVLLLF